MNQRCKLLIILLVLSAIVFYSLGPCFAYTQSAQVCCNHITAARPLYKPLRIRHKPWRIQFAQRLTFRKAACSLNAKELDESTGFYDYGARQYDPIIHRFVSGDTEEFDLDDPQTLNRYSYTLNNPLKYTDPTGNLPITDIIDVGFFATSFTKFIRAPSKQTAIDLALDSLGLLPLVPSIGSIKLVGKAISKVGEAGKMGEMASSIRKVEEGGRIVIGKMADLRKPSALAKGEKTLDLPDLGSPKANWKLNSSRLREAESTGKPIRDASVTKSGGLRDNTGFLRAERNLLTNRGRQYDAKTSLWQRISSINKTTAGSKKPVAKRIVRGRR